MFVAFLLRLGDVYSIYLSHMMIHLSIVSWFSGSIKCSRSVCCLSYHSGARGLYKHWLYNLVFMFRFLWISAGLTYSALPVNAKEVSGDIRFRWKLLFHCCSMIMDSRCSCTCSHSTGFELCLLSIPAHICVYLIFRYPWMKHAWDGSSHFNMSMNTSLPFIKTNL